MSDEDSGPEEPEAAPAEHEEAADGGEPPVEPSAEDAGGSDRSPAQPEVDPEEAPDDARNAPSDGDQGPPQDAPPDAVHNVAPNLNFVVKKAVIQLIDHICHEIKLFNVIADRPEKGFERHIT
jgi:hypothetical protein